MDFGIWNEQLLEIMHERGVDLTDEDLAAFWNGTWGDYLPDYIQACVERFVEEAFSNILL